MINVLKLSCGDAKTWAQCLPDGGRRDLKAFLLHHSSKPFSQKTEREKDELYEHIAGQLATIAYNYAFDSPHNSSVKPQEPSLVAEGAKSAAVCK